MPEVCLCLEVIFCEACSISATRMAMMDSRDIQPDPCDSRLIRLNNCLALLACIFHILALIEDSLAQIAALIELLADIVYSLVAACMLTQTHVEVSAFQPSSLLTLNKREL